MNEKISIILNEYLPNWIDRQGTILKILAREENGKVGKYPVSLNYLKKTCEAGDYISLIPDSRYRSISFWTTSGGNISKSFGMIDVQVTLRLVVWVNHKLINQAVNVDDLMLSVIKDIPENIGISGDFSKIRTRLINAGKENIWTNFSLKEEDKQFLLYPFDWFTLDYQVNYSFHQNCLNDINLNPTSC